jgi:hypothetical protein
MPRLVFAGHGSATQALATRMDTRQGATHRVSFDAWTTPRHRDVVAIEALVYRMVDGDGHFVTEVHDLIDVGHTASDTETEEYVLGQAARLIESAIASGDAYVCGGGIR